MAHIASVGWLKNDFMGLANVSQPAVGRAALCNAPG
jgi:hypothetical protein